MATEPHYQWQGETLILHCHLQPKAAKNEIVGPHNGLLKIKVTAPPVDGKANVHLIKFLGKAFGVPKSAVRLQKGHASRQKIVAVVAPKRFPVASQITEDAPQEYTTGRDCDSRHKITPLSVN